MFLRMCGGSDRSQQIRSESSTTSSEENFRSQLCVELRSQGFSIRQIAKTLGLGLGMERCRGHYKPVPKVLPPKRTARHWLRRRYRATNWTPDAVPKVWTCGTTSFRVRLPSHLLESRFCTSTGNRQYSHLGPRFQRSPEGSRNRTRNFAAGNQNISG